MSVATPSDAQLDRRILRGSGWVAVGYGGRNVAAMLATLVLVRLVEPEAFGLIALAWVALTVAFELEGAGIGAALVYHRGSLAKAASSAFVFTVAAGAAVYAVVFAVAPLLATAFETPALTDVIRVLALLLVLRSFGTVPSALLEREIDFRSRAKAEVAGALVQVAVSVGLAFGGYGVWSLVFGQLAGSAVQTALYWLFVSWRPSLRLASLATARELFRYGRFVSATNVVNIANNSVDNIVLGRLLGTASLGIYAVAFRLADFPNYVIGHVVSGAMFTVYTLLRDERDRVLRAYLQNLQRIALFALPVSIGLVVAAEPVVLALLGEEWRAAVTPLRILAIYGLIKSLVAPSGDIFKGVGRPQLGLVFGGAQVAVSLAALLILAPAYGLAGAAGAMLLALVTCGVVRLAWSLRLLDGSLAELGRALAPSLLCGAVLAAALVALLPVVEPFGPAAELAILTAAGAFAYVAATAVFARSIVRPIWGGWRGVSPGAAR
ncbi:MAG: lipopolysaccharide biosynthesis protein [Gaiellales bacterium]